MSEVNSMSEEKSMKSTEGLYYHPDPKGAHLLGEYCKMIEDIAEKINASKKEKYYE